MYRICTVVGIIFFSGLLGGWAAYLMSFTSSIEGIAGKKNALARYLVLGVIAAAVVPLFLSVLQSALISNIFEPKANAPDAIPFSEFLILTGFCLIAAISARRFLYTVSRQIMRDVSSANLRAQNAELAARQAETKAEIATELVDETVEDDKVGIPDVLQAAKEFPAGAAIPTITSNERNALNAMMGRAFRTAMGVSQDSKIPRSHMGELLDHLQELRLVERTVSPNTGGSRWRITPLGVRTLNATDPK